jgi:hypothetical protein
LKNTKGILILLLLFVCHFSNAQDKVYVRDILNVLCDSTFHGRGYVSRGDQLAATYIQTQFEQLGLEKYNQSYFQHYNLSVNTLPAELALAVDGQQLKPGVDYLIDPSSPTIKGKFKAYYLGDSTFENWEYLKDLLSNKQKYILVIDGIKVKPDILNNLMFSTAIKLGGIAILSNQKLTWRASTLQSIRPLLTIHKSVIEKKIKKVSLNATSVYHKSYKTQNVIGRIQGLSDSIILMSAHYDHLGRMGKSTYFPGANDNASGIALMLDIAKYYTKSTPKYTMVFMAFGAEELGLLGSTHFVNDPIFPLSNIKFMLNFDISGTGDEGIQVVNGTIFKSRFEQLKKINGDNNLLKQVKIRGESCNSDHCPFYRKGVPSFFIYTLGGIQAYHDIYDRSETLPLTAYDNYFKLLTFFISGI